MQTMVFIAARRLACASALGFCGLMAGPGNPALAQALSGETPVVPGPVLAEAEAKNLDKVLLLTALA